MLILCHGGERNRAWSAPWFRRLSAVRYIINMQLIHVLLTIQTYQRNQYVMPSVPLKYTMGFESLMR